MEFDKIRMEDVGTRLDHLTQLKDLWEFAHTMLVNQNKLYSTAEDKIEAKKLESALEMLNHHMQKDYSEFNYRIEINTIPRARE